MTQLNQSLGTVQAVKREEVLLNLDGKVKQTMVDNIPVMSENSSDFVDPRDVPTTVIGHCKFFNLSKEEDRQEYADLVARLSTEMNFDRLFEERSMLPTGELIIYIAYLEYIKIV